MSKSINIRLSRDLFDIPHNVEIHNVVLIKQKNDDIECVVNYATPDDYAPINQGGKQ